MDGRAMRPVRRHGRMCPTSILASGGMTEIEFEIPENLPPPIGDVAVAIPASTVARERVEWLREGRIPLGGVTLLVGDPGLGKSLLTCALAAGHGGTTLMATAEDSLSATVRPRLEAVNANLDHVYFVKMRRTDGISDGIKLPDDHAELDRLVAEVGASLVVIDPITAHLPDSVNSWRDQSVRLALAPLHWMAEERRCAVVAVAHLNKSMGVEPLYRIGGSMGFAAAARSVLLLARDPDDEEPETGRRRIVAHVKCNVAPLAPSLVYEVDPIVIPAADGDPEVETARLLELGESDHGGHALLTRRDGEEERSARAEAEDFLRDELSDGDRPAREIKNAARDMGIKPDTLKRAKKALGVQSERQGGIADRGAWVWRLPDAPALSGASPIRPLGSDAVNTLSSNPHEQTDSEDNDSLRSASTGYTPLRAAEAENGRHRVPGDPGFPSLLDGAFHDGHITQAEWLERRKVHAAIVIGARP